MYLDKVYLVPIWSKGVDEPKMGRVYNVITDLSSFFSSQL